MEFFDKITKKATETYQYTAEKTNKFAKETKLKAQMNHHKDEIEELYIEIGKRVYQNHIRENDEHAQDEINQTCHEIDQIAKVIESERDELLKLKDMKKCYQCDTQIELNFHYCPICGADQIHVSETKEPEEKAETISKDTEIEMDISSNLKSEIEQVEELDIENYEDDEQ